MRCVSRVYSPVVVEIVKPEVHNSWRLKLEPCTALLTPQVIMVEVVVEVKVIQWKGWNEHEQWHKDHHITCNNNSSSSYASNNNNSNSRKCMNRSSRKRVSRRQWWNDRLVCVRFVPSWAFPHKLNCTVEVYFSVVLAVRLLPRWVYRLYLFPCWCLLLLLRRRRRRHFVGLGWCSCGLHKRAVCFMRWHDTPSGLLDLHLR